MIKQIIIAAIFIGCYIGTTEARSVDNNQEDQSISPVIPSPNQDFGDFSPLDQDDIIRRPAAGKQLLAASNEASVPVYVSPFVRSERALSFDRQESSHAPPNYAPRPQASVSSHYPISSINPSTAQHHGTTKDLKTSASYGHHHGGHHHGGYHHGGGYDHAGWLDMGAWTGGKGSFGWYADYPVGGKHYGYGRK